MPIVEVMLGQGVSDCQVADLAAVLPHAVSTAVECPEEPYDGRLGPGDVELRFRSLGPHDSSGLDVTIEIRSKWFASRAENRQQRCDAVLAAVTDVLNPLRVGVYLMLPVAAWSQTE
ncbi:unannotated protein [freshwater metagenome]|jgi:hypothetical protein|uniref:Unannotated protein n=1 Tax=freshwater metagenome TaxID=449393 RepID=A0A6J6V6Y7_9ZZZZ|nr:hypothetical protein [Actinomycetota bacterium]